MARQPETLDEGALAVPLREMPRLEPQLFVVLECDRPGAGSSRHSLAEVEQVLIGRGTARDATRDAATLALRVPGAFMSTSHARIRREGERFVLHDASSRNGTFHDGKRIAERRLEDGDVFECGHTLFLFRSAVAVRRGSAADDDSSRDGARLPGLRTMLPALAERYAQLEVIASSEVPLLLLGETGSGKEVAARAAHTLSKRSGAFVPVNCGAIPEPLIESQLFGHVKGAFSGAVRDELGFIRAADGGTLFLDEIGDLPKVSQAALLRVLQQREVTPVGSTRTIPVDIRVISATHQPIEDEELASSFRRDLLARLAGFTFHLPRLQDRIEDLGLLIAELLPDADRKLAVDAGRALLRYRWPLNVRELQQVLASASVLARRGPILLEHLPRAVLAPTEGAGAKSAPFDALEGDALRDALTEALSRHRGNVAAVAREAGKAPMQIHRWMRRFAIDPRSFRS